MERLEQMRAELATMEKLGLTGFSVDYLREQITKMEATAEADRVKAMYSKLSELATVALQELTSHMNECGISQATLDIVIKDGLMSASFKTGYRTLKNEITGEAETTKKGTPVTVGGIEYPSMSKALVAHGYEYKLNAVGKVGNGKNYEQGVAWLKSHTKLEVIPHK